MLKKFTKFIQIIIVLLFILLEEIAWNYLGKPIYNRIISFKITERFKKWLMEQRNQYIVLLIFLFPFVPDNILTIYLGKAIAEGMIFTIVGIYVFKALFSILTVIIFKISKKELIKFKIIKIGYYYLLLFLRSKYYKFVRNKINLVKEALKEDYILFQKNYFNGNSSFKEETKRVYLNIKHILRENK